VLDERGAASGPAPAAADTPVPNGKAHRGLLDFFQKKFEKLVPQKNI
jgi:hypothetical protein